MTLCRLASPLRAVRGVLLGSLLAACDTGPTTPAPELQIEPSGRMERGSTVVLRAMSGGVRVPPAEIRWSVEPVGAAETVSDSSVRLIREGKVTLAAEWNGGRGSLTIDVAIPPPVVFELLKDGNRDVYRVDLDGSNLIRLTTHPAADAGPTVARGVIVFSSERDGNAELYSIPLGGGAEQRLTTTPANETDPALSADGSRLAYVSDSEELQRIWMADAQGRGAVRLRAGLDEAGAVFGSPAWAPGGRLLAFMSTANRNADLFGWALEGTASLLAGGPRAEVEPAWSPDGSSLAFASNRTGDTEIFLLTLATGEVRQLTSRPGTDAQPTWTSDGRLIYVEFGGSVSRLVWIDPATPEEVREIPVGAGTPTRPAGT